MINARKDLILVLFLLASPGVIFSLSEETLHLTFLGDLMAHDVNFKIKDYSVAYKDIRDDLLGDDCTFTNLEAPVNNNEPFFSYPSFNMRREYVQAAIDAGIDSFSLANNHSFDRGLEGIIQTLCSMVMLKESRNMDLYFSGIRADTETEFKPVTITKKGWKIGFIAMTQFLNTLRKNPNVFIADYRNEAEAAQCIEFVKKYSPMYDLFIVSYHGDAEYSLVPDPLKKTFFQKLVGAGCDIVYGHHPHVLQPYEIVTEEGRRGLLMYSMGNFLSGQRWSSEPFDINHYRSYTGDSIILKVLAENKDGKPYIEVEKPIIITNFINEKREVVVTKLTDLINNISDPKWRTYYQNRLELMKQLVSNFPIARN
jgi:poly-gamma-glutamate capsule biosynthesis protein CapA/YwtB (metallophosphatase superfamily)